jgi:hypothetical protein
MDQDSRKMMLPRMDTDAGIGDDDDAPCSSINDLFVILYMHIGCVRTHAELNFGVELRQTTLESCFSTTIFRTSAAVFFLSFFLSFFLLIEKCTGGINA